jgi:hypothetical protein
VPDGITSATTVLAASKAITNANLELSEKSQWNHKLLACGPRACLSLTPFHILR